MPFAFAALGFLISSSFQRQPALSLSDLQRFMQQVENAVKAGEPWAIDAGKHVSVHYVGHPGPDLDRATAVIDAAVETDCAALGLTLPTDKVDVYLFPSSTDLGHALGLGPVQDGISMGKWSAISLDGGFGEKNLASIASQQLGYALVHDQLGLYGWKVFNEGVGLYLRASAEHAAWIQGPIPVESKRMTELVKTASSPADLEEGAEFIGFLIRRDHGNPSRLKVVLADLSEERLSDLRIPGKEDAQVRVDRAFTAAYGESLAKLEHEWREGV
jgi:hypothetical protein